MGNGMNLSDDEIKTLILALYYYQQEYQDVEIAFTVKQKKEKLEIKNEVIALRDKLEDHLLSTQSPEDAKVSADFMKALARLYA